MTSPNRFGNARRRFNTFALLLTLAVSLSACADRQQRLESSLDKASNFLHQNDWDKANVEVRNALQIDPKNARAYLLMAQISEGQREVQRAFGAYSKAVELNPKLWAAQTGLARMLLFAGEVERCDKVLDTVLAGDPRNSGARTLKAALLVQRGKAEAAESALVALIGEGRPVTPDSALLLAGLLAKSGRTAQALALIERALDDEPRDIGLLRVAAELAATNPPPTAQGDAADTYYRRAVAEAPKRSDLWRAWAEHHLRQGHDDRAEAVLREAAGSQPANDSRAIDLLQLVTAHRGLAEGERAYRAAIDKEPRRMALRFALADTLRTGGQWAAADQVLADVASANVDPQSVVSANSQLAAAALGRGDVAAARSRVSAALAVDPRVSTALLVRGHLALLEGRARDAIADLRAVVRDLPASPEAVGLLARAHRSAGEPGLARDVLAEAVKLRPDSAPLRLLLVDDMLADKDPTSAAAELDAGLKAAPLALELVDAKVGLAQRRGDSAGAEKTLLALRAAAPDQSAAALRLAGFYAAQGRTEAALREFDAASTLAPNDPLPILSGIGLLLKNRRFDQANARVDSRLAQNAASPILRIARGDIAASRGDLAAAERSYQSALEIEPKSVVAHLSLASVLSRRGDDGGAMAVLQQGQNLAPNAMPLPIARAELLTRIGRVDDALAIYENLLTMQPGNDAVVNNLAYVLAEYKGDKASVERALLLAQRLANSPNSNYLDSLGWIHHKHGDAAEAVHWLERALALAPESPDIRLHLGLALVRQGSAERGRALVRKAIAARPDLRNQQEARALLATG